MNAQPPYPLEKTGLLSGIIDLFQRPFPVMENWEMRWVVILFHGLFVALFLSIFQPFKDIFDTGSNTPFINIGFGVVVSLVLAFNHFLISKVLPIDLKKWTIGKSILWTLFDVVTVILAVFIYKNSWTSFDSFTWLDLWKITYSTILLAVIPVMMSTILLENWLLRRNLRRASQLQQSVESKPKTSPQPSLEGKTPELITLYSDNQSEWIKLRARDLLLLESSDNYVCIYYREKDKVQKKLLRSTLTKLEEEINLPFIFRCHRSFMVNLDQIKQVHGNSRGLQLDLLDLEQPIPVSRKYVKIIQERMKSEL